MSADLSPDLHPDSPRAAQAIPSRPHSQWPVGARLRFRADARLKAGNDNLRGSAVLVLSELRLVGGFEAGYSWRQQVLAFGAGCTPGWARPDQLALPLDEPREGDAGF